MTYIEPNALVLLVIISKCAALNLLAVVGNLTQPPDWSSKNKDFVQLASEYKYKTETHEVKTEDGYILTLHRIPCGNKCTKKTPCLLMHGLFQSSECFVSSGADSPGFILAQECYDVWFGNVRGTFHSRKHKTLDPDRDLKFWKFSFDDIALYDIPAMIDYVLNETGTRKLIYMGFSQGSGTFMAMNSEKPEYANKISLFIGLAPSTRNYHTRSILFRTVSDAANSLETPLEATGVWEVLSKGMPIQGALSALCQVELLAAIVCGLAVAVIDSPHPGSLTPETKKAFAENTPAGTSVQNLARYGQAMNDLRFLKFSYGSAENLKIYGNIAPPQYNLSANTMPTLIIQGKADHVVDPQDVEWSAAQVPNLLKYVVVNDPLWNHLDMCYSRYWRGTIFVTLKSYLDKYTESE